MLFITIGLKSNPDYLYCAFTLIILIIMTVLKKTILIAGIILLTVQNAESQLQYGWRGPGRSGIFNETSLMKSWPSAGPVLLWENNEIGTGYSSATVTGDAVYITGRKGENDVITSFNQTGTKKWEVVYGTRADGNYPDSRCTPTVAKERIFVISGQGDMVCMDKGGKIIWSVNYFKAYGAKTPTFGISESPLVVDNLVIGTPGGNKAAMVAYNITDGKVVWETESLNEGTHYVNPLLIEDKGMRIIVTHSATQIIGVNPTDGKLIWKFNYEAENAQQSSRRNHINTPIYKDGYLFAANGYGQVSVKLKLNWDGSAPTLVWKNLDINPHLGGMVLLGNYIFSSTHDTNSKGRWICVDWTTGKTLWINEWYNKGAVISAEGLLYIYEEKSGHIGLVKPNKEKLEILSEYQITKGTGPYWSHPVINKGRLFIRHGEYLAVYSIKAK
jgi:outer membrane protein assembly factor BamB